MLNSFSHISQLVSIENLLASTGQNQTSVIHLQKFVMEIGVVERGRQSASATSDVTDVAKPADKKSTTNILSLFNNNIRMSHTQEADLFSMIGTLHSAITDHIQIPHQSYTQDLSVVATFHSRPLSAVSESLKINTFRIYLSEESGVNHLVVKALVLGEFRSVVSFCLSTEQYANAILLAVKKGPGCLTILKRPTLRRA